MRNHDGVANDASLPWCACGVEPYRVRPILADTVDRLRADLMVKQPTIHICRSDPWSLAKRYCPFCDEEVDGIYREGFDGYVNDWVCGFCGTWIGCGEYNPNISQSERRRNVALVERIVLQRKEPIANNRA